MRFSVFNPDAERREGLKALLRQIDRRARFNDAPDWRAADRVMQRFMPNLFVIDWHDSIRVGELQAFTSRYPDLPVAALIDEASSPVVLDLLAEGARGVIPRTADACLIVRVFEIVLLGGNHVPADALRPIAAPPRRAAVPSLPPPQTKLTGSLSPRQQQIMRCVHMGSTNKMIARTLGISEGTVKIHLASIFQQLGAPNRAAAVAIYNGWLASQLQVLRTRDELAPRPVPGQPGPVPLRARNGATFRYPLLTDDTAGALPLAAEPATPFGEAAQTEQDTAEPIGSPLPDDC
ncbi:DNA-binding response regulator [Burkholderia sp. WAC0059]|uniref:helix-turn-helix transcriptional regulator n=1 Tax=Burkholderia sp. WAC0059 TaxID=2066022 RepID=UPI000C7EA992|nr:response regulator transcription factor [Burkholderia sp. WAC0059]PLZ01045.1 DNA-binding response regulator [Burkholderia sp. WAC0059]